MFDKENKRILVDIPLTEMIRIFGMLSPSHHKDIIEIIKAVSDNL